MAITVVISPAKCLANEVGHKTKCQGLVCSLGVHLVLISSPKNERQLQYRTCARYRRGPAVSYAICQCSGWPPWTGWVCTHDVYTCCNRRCHLIAIDACPIFLSDTSLILLEWPASFNSCTEHRRRANLSDCPLLTRPPVKACVAVVCLANFII